VHKREVSNRILYFAHVLRVTEAHYEIAIEECDTLSTVMDRGMETSVTLREYCTDRYSGERVVEAAERDLDRTGSTEGNQNDEVIVVIKRVGVRHIDRRGRGESIGGILRVYV
jgi:hypothetical protein